MTRQNEALAQRGTEPTKIDETRSVSMERDPVCGMSVEPRQAAAHVVHAGNAYYFCAAGCAARFKASPEKFLSPQSAARQVPASAPQAPAKSASASARPEQGVRYTCPMHPQIVQIGPGSCPICGM